MAADAIEAQLKRVPQKAGVYLFRDAQGDVLYVGKAKTLRPRVRSYFQAGSSDTRQGIKTMAARVDTIETIVTQTEVEALHLEQNLVKRHRPPFNVRLRDDKSFPYIAAAAQDQYPPGIFPRAREPPSNVRLRDDKSFPYIAVTVQDEYPRVIFTRERHRPGRSPRCTGTTCRRA